MNHGTLQRCVVIGSGAMVLATMVARAGAGRPTAAALAPSELAPIAASMSAERIRANLDTLCSFGTRHTLSTTESDSRGIGAARRWVKRAFEDAVRGAERSGDEEITAWFDAHMVEPDGRRIPRQVEIVNVCCTIPGSMPEARDRHYYILAHLDSRASEPLDGESDAPGANDAASGVAMMIEMARHLANMRCDSTIVLMATSGEEQGLYGARLHAIAAQESGVDIRAVLNNDMVGDPYGPFDRNSEKGKHARGVVRVFAQGIPPAAPMNAYQTISRLGAENDSPSRTIARYMEDVAGQHALPVKPWVIYRNDRFLRGGDHTPFLELGFPGVRVTVPYEDYKRQHQDVRVENGVQYGDLGRYVDEKYLADVGKLNLLSLIHLANAPSSPSDARLLAAELTNDTTIRWSPSPEPDVAGYEVVWRETTSPHWQHVKDVGRTNEATIDLSKDNWLFGVRAYDAQGYRSPVSFPAAATE